MKISRFSIGDQSSVFRKIKILSIILKLKRLSDNILHTHSKLNAKVNKYF